MKTVRIISFRFVMTRLVTASVVASQLATFLLVLCGEDDQWSCGLQNTVHAECSRRPGIYSRFSTQYVTVFVASLFNLIGIPSCDC
jgi:hypothetical protein